MVRLMTPPTSAELITRWVQGDREAGREIYDRYFKRAWKFGLAITHQELEAEEVAQAAITHGLDVVRDPSRRPERFTGWLLGVVKHMAWRRSGRRNQPLTTTLQLEDKRHERPSVAIIDSEMAGVLERALTTLSADDRALVEGRFIHKVDRAEMARRFNCSVDTIDRRTKLAIVHLRSFLSGHFTTCVLMGKSPTMGQVLALRPSFRAAFLARHVEGLSVPRAAAKLGLPVPTLEERLRYAYDLLGCTEKSDFAALRRPV